MEGALVSIVLLLIIFGYTMALLQKMIDKDQIAITENDELTIFDHELLYTFTEDVFNMALYIHDREGRNIYDDTLLNITFI